jgi:hypothetical protein
MLCLWHSRPDDSGWDATDVNRIAERVAQAMLKMVKLDIAGLQAAYDGRAAA